MAAQDFELTDDMTIENGDFKIIESDQQHIEHIITAAPGNFYEHPTLGASFKSLLNSSETMQRIKQIIGEQLEKDDFVVKDIFIEKTEDETNIEIDADRRKK